MSDPVGARRWPRAAAAAGALLLVTASGLAQEQEPVRPSDQELRTITERGRRIASYHEAIAAARQRVAERTRLDERVRPVVVDRNGVWHVAFVLRELREGDAMATLLVADVVFARRAGAVERLETFDPPRPAPSDAQAALRAIDTARSGTLVQAGAVRPPFAESVFRDSGGRFTVYLQSRTGTAKATRFGSDLKATVTGDGNQVLEMTPLHGAGAATDVAAGDGKTPTLHSHAEGDLPTETDVALVIEQPKVAPHLVLTPLWMFRIEADGVLTWLGRNEVPPVTSGGGA